MCKYTTFKTNNRFAFPSRAQHFSHYTKVQVCLLAFSLRVYCLSPCQAWWLSPHAEYRGGMPRPAVDAGRQLLSCKGSCGAQVRGARWTRERAAAWAARRRCGPQARYHWAGSRATGCGSTTSRPYLPPSSGTRHSVLNITNLFHCLSIGMAWRSR